MLDSWNGFTVASGPNVGRCPSGNMGFMTLGASPEISFGAISAASNAAMILEWGLNSDALLSVGDTDQMGGLRFREELILWMD